MTLSLGLLPMLPSAADAAPVGQGFNLNPSDLKFILQQIRIAEAHAAGGELLGSGPDQIPNAARQGAELPFGLRTVDGTLNNLTAGKGGFGAADRAFPRLTDADHRAGEPWAADPDGPGPLAVGAPTSYAQKKGLVNDSRPRMISNLVVDQTAGNPAAVAAAGPGATPGASGAFDMPNTAPDAGLSAPYNSWFTLFGQFFDHGLDMVSKGGGTVYLPLRPDDPLYDPNSPTNFMVLTRSLNQPGPDGVLGDNPATPAVDESADDVRDATNQTATFVDQSQTYASHPAHQVFLRTYAANAAGRPVSTGALLTGERGGLATWTSVKAQARAMLGIALTDNDVANIPLVATDPYGRFLRGPNGYPQLVRPGNVLVEGDPAANGGAGVAVPADAIRTGHAFLDDIAHHAAPGTVDHDRNPATPKVALTPDGDPGTTDDNIATTYDDEMLGRHFITGDGRANENIGLSAVHHLFHSEHNRVLGDIKNVLTTEDSDSLPEWQLGSAGWNGERLFQAAKFVTEMQYQHLAFEEFARKVQPRVNVFADYDTTVNSAIAAEFAHVVYRFGHSMLTETVDRVSADGVRFDKPLLDVFLNPPAYFDGGPAGQLSPEQAAGGIVRGMTGQVGNELDEFVTEALRNKLLGLPLDLATLNIARGRETGMPSLNDARRQFHATAGHPALKPYANWNDFGAGLRHRESLVNFVAGYGTHPTITGTLPQRRAAAARLVAGDAAVPGTPGDAVAFMEGVGAWADTGTGLDDVDFWVGGLAERQLPFGGLLGSTFNFVFESQLERLQDGDRFYYLSRTAGLNLLTQLEGNSFAELIERNTDVEGLPADVFSRPDHTFRLAGLGSSGPIQDDPGTVADERALLTRMPDGTVRYGGDKHVVLLGTAGADRARSGDGDDTLLGQDGDDRLEGGAGNDGLVGGTGDDILTDEFGDDDLKGGDGDDAIGAGAGLDLVQGGLGKDFLHGGSDPTEHLAGPGDDVVYGGESADTVFGDDGDDWMQGGDQGDLLQGDNGAPFQDDPNTPGDDVLLGEGGADDHHAEGGHDIMVNGPGADRYLGNLGFDWVTHKGDPAAADADLRRTGLVNPALDTVNDRYDQVEGLSGWDHDDILNGDDATAATMIEHELMNTAQVDKVRGLRAALGGAASFTGGNVLLGGAGNDRIAGHGGDDIIDGDAWLNVRLSVRTDPADPATEVRSVDSVLAMQSDVFAGRIDPGHLVIVREILHSPTAGDDAAVFSEFRANYDLVQLPNGDVRITHARGSRADGVDTVRNIERLVFGAGAGAEVVRVPDAPTIGEATAGDAAAMVRWTPVAGGVPATGYEVRAFAGAGASPAKIVRVGAAATAATLTGLTNGTGYRFRVLASSAVGSSAPSALSNEVIPLGPPGAPTVGVPSRGRASATVRWSAPAGAGGALVTGYRVQVLAGTSTLVKTVTAPPGARHLLVTGLANGRAYTFRVAAVNAAGVGPLSARSAAVVPATAPSAPRIGTASSGASGGTVTATARWGAPASNGGAAITGYRVVALRLSASGAVLSTRTSGLRAASGRSYSFRLSQGRYRFQVYAVNVAGAGPRSSRSNQVTAR
ncbi:peroxidase family protein [Pilimelia columellifera]|uniref:Fibronectin type-III domain-containing protein n=1 Tax=Pilimelia columellifera subsp. columellifera TaxID=706583 RepID=A0ABN3N519_9ACTN